MTVVVAIVSFVAGMFIFRQIGYNEGIRFAVTSGSKQAYSLGFEMGYELRDSIAIREKELRDANLFNLNIIEQEAANPKDHIIATGETFEKQADKAGLKKFVNIRINSAAQFARYKEMDFSVKFLGLRNAQIGEIEISPSDILYPGRTVEYEIFWKDVPEFTQTIEVRLIKATGMD